MIGGIINDLFSKDDINDTNNYHPCVIKFKNEEKSIYNVNSINLLRDLFAKI